MDELEQIHQQIAELQKKAEEIYLVKRSAALDDVKSKITLYGFTAKELALSAGDKAQTKRNIPVSIKYKQGEKTWTGRGRKPKWLEDYLAQDGKLEELLVK